MVFGAGMGASRKRTGGAEWAGGQGGRSSSDTLVVTSLSGAKARDLLQSHEPPAGVGYDGSTTFEQIPRPRCAPS